MTDPLYTTLDNGLTVILKRMTHAPVASFWIFYRVGSRNERTGETGISHFVEHMLFKGTPTFPAQSLKRAIEREGGVWNGMTSMDSTKYYATLPVERLDLALRIESDRMRNALFDPDDVESERTVIISEREGHENSPGWRLGEEVRALAFRVHPYHHAIIGDKADLRTITRDQLYRHYQTYYAPNNAIVVASGDFAPDVLLARIADLFGVIPAAAPPPPVTRAEPPMAGERRVHLTGPDPTAFVHMAYRTPSVSDPDYYSLTMLDAILDGASAQHRSSRLYQALVETELATAVSSSYGASLDPYLFSFSATVRDGESPADIEAALQREIERVAGEPVAEREMAKALKQVQAQIAYVTETVGGQASRLGTAEILGDYRMLDRLLARLQAVTAADIQRVAATYLVPTQRVIGWYTPQAAAWERSRP